MENKSVECNGTKIWLGDDGILRSIMKAQGIKDTLTNKKETVHAIDQLCNGKKRPFLADIRTEKSLDESKNHYSDYSQEVPPISAMAMIVPVLLSRKIGAYFLGSHKPMFPFRPFTDEDKATSWLKKFIT
ncbi:MAG: hypothetical protein JXJ04_20185 [Spirochaetales bacterium]|nr:hypothetical protein [Spirochaetales bacterium]